MYPVTYYNGRWHLYTEGERREFGERKRQEQSEFWHAKWISKSGLKERLWTDKAIAEFLGKPRKAGPIMAWTRTEVVDAENTPDFKIWMKERCTLLVVRGKLSADVFDTRLTQTQREFLKLVSAGKKVVRNKTDQFRWIMGNKSCTRIARKLKDAGLISCIYRTAYYDDVEITTEGLCALAVS